MISRVSPTGASSCSTPLDRNLALGKKLGVSGTPAIFFTDGTRVPGAADAATLERKFASIKK